MWELKKKINRLFQALCQWDDRTERAGDERGLVEKKERSFRLLLSPFLSHISLVARPRFPVIDRLHWQRAWNMLRITKTTS